MARKDRVPNPPKRPQAPQRRHTPTDPASAARRRRLYLAGGLAALVVVVALGAAFLRNGGDGGEGGDGVAQALRAAGCTYQTFPAQERGHTTSIVEKIKWNSAPPTNGMHYQAPAIWGAYREPLLLSQVVHNLEHGGVYVLYGSRVPDDVVSQLRAVYDDDPVGLLLAPLPSLGGTFALGAWNTASEDAPEEGRGILAKCEQFDENAVRTFVDEMRFKAPERFPPEALQPGS